MLWIWVLRKCTDRHKILDVTYSEHHCAYSFSSVLQSLYMYLYQPAIYGKISYVGDYVSVKGHLFLTLLWTLLNYSGSAAANGISQISLAVILYILICWMGLHKATWSGELDIFTADRVKKNVF